MDEADWAGLFHREGPAVDTPGHLAALLGDPGDHADAFVAGYRHLWSVTLRREGKAWPATASAAVLVAESLDDPRLGPEDPTVAEALLAYLREVGAAADLGGAAGPLRARVTEATAAAAMRRWTADYLASDAHGRTRLWAEEPELRELVLDAAVLACFDAVPRLLNRVLPDLASARARRRAAAAGAVGTLARHPASDGRRTELVARLVVVAEASRSPYELGTVVVAIGELAGDTRPWLAHANPGVRVCAAVAPALAGDGTAERVLRQLREAPGMFGAAFGAMAPPVQFLAASPPARYTQAVDRPRPT